MNVEHDIQKCFGFSKYKLPSPHPLSQISNYPIRPHILPLCTASFIFLISILNILDTHDVLNSSRKLCDAHPNIFSCTRISHVYVCTSLVRIFLQFVCSPFFSQTKYVSNLFVSIAKRTSVEGKELFCSSKGKQICRRRLESENEILQKRGNSQTVSWISPLTSVEKKNTNK